MINYYHRLQPDIAATLAPLYASLKDKLKDLNTTLLCDVRTGRPRLWIPAPMYRRMFDFIHSLSHPSRRSTAQLLKTKFLWHSITKEGKDWVRACTSCHTSKVHRHNDSEVGTSLQPQRRFAHIHINVTSAFDPAANEMVEHFHHSLKAALMYRFKDSNWFTNLHWVLLKLRTTPKDAMDVSAAEVVYCDQLVFPAKFFHSEPPPTISNAYII
ncbi:uncharacterized protein [Palaemon carinicauda]|uniref:uncharacterized protein n=1 Tax=Palaemon carinicauda TaxID=392227 RepID=UPI0035B5C58A